MTPDDPRHGTVAGYQAHRRANQAACDHCKRAAAQYQDRRNYERAIGATRRLDPTGTHRRVRALMRLGWTGEQIALAAGWETSQHISNLMRRDAVLRETAQRVQRAYRALSGKPGPSLETRRRAEAKGWPPPLAWDDIDTDRAPRGVR